MDCESNDKVKAALDDVMREILKGAYPLKMDGDVETKMRANYCPDFYVNIGDYDNAKLKILMLSRIVGHLAAFFSYGRAVLNAAATPEYLDYGCTNWAGYLVSRTLCPPPGATTDPQAFGKHCKNYPKPGNAVAEAAVSILRQLVQLAVPPVTGGPFRS